MAYTSSGGASARKPFLRRFMSYPHIVVIDDAGQVIGQSVGFYNDEIIYGGVFKADIICV